MPNWFSTEDSNQTNIIPKWRRDRARFEEGQFSWNPRNKEKLKFREPTAFIVPPAISAITDAFDKFDAMFTPNSDEVASLSFELEGNNIFLFKHPFFTFLWRHSHFRY